jgi:hypothetical protein
LNTQQQIRSTGSKTKRSTTITITTIITTAVMCMSLQLLHMLVVGLMACKWQPGQRGSSAHMPTGSSSSMLSTQQTHGAPCVSQ